MNLKEQRAAALTAAQEIVDGAKAAKVALTEDQAAQVDAKFAEIEKLDKDIARDAKSADLFARVASIAPGSDGEKAADRGEETARTLGEHFVKAVGQEGLTRVKSQSNATISAPEFKAASDTHVVGDAYDRILTTHDPNPVREYRRPLITDVLGTGSIGSSTSVTYELEGGVEGGFTTVAEGGQKPQFHFTPGETRTDSLKKIAGFIKYTDEMAEDLPFVVSEINNRGLYMLSMTEENQLLNGDGTGSNVLGMLKRDGLGVETAEDNTDNADAVFRATTQVQNVTGLTADAILIHPTDYQTFRLAKDGNQQYYGGGFFSGQYGNGGIVSQPPLWGLNTIVTSAVEAGTVVVGAFKAATTVYRKGGVRVESTNSHASDFTNNLITTRIEERIALAVRIPAAIVKVTLSSSDPVAD